MSSFFKTNNFKLNIACATSELNTGQRNCGYKKNVQNVNLLNTNLKCEDTEVKSFILFHWLQTAGPGTK